MRSALLPAIILSAVSVTCSLSTYENTPCTQGTDECQVEYGYGSICGSDGFCSDTITTSRCTITYPDDLFVNPEDYRNHFIIGSLYNSITNGSEVAAIELAAREASSSPLGGREFGVVYCNYSQGSVNDTMAPGDATRANVDYLVNVLGVDVIIGPHESSLAAEAYNRLEELGSDTVLISPSASADQLRTIDTTSPTNENPGGLWRTVPESSFVGNRMATFVNREYDAYILQDPVPTEPYEVAIVYQDDLDASAIRTVIENGLVEDINVTLFPFANPSMEASVVSAGSENPNLAIFLHSTSSNMQEMIDAAGNSGSYNNVRILLPDIGRDEFVARESFSSELNPTFLGDVDGEPRIIGVSASPDRDSSTYLSFRGRYEAAFPNNDAEQSAFTAHTYDAAWMAILGIAYSFQLDATRNVVSGTEIAKGLRRLTGGETRVEVGSDNWSIARRQLANANATIDIVGASGQLDYDLSIEELANEPGNFTFELWGLVADDRCPEDDIDGRCFITIEENFGE